MKKIIVVTALAGLILFNGCSKKNSQETAAVDWSKTDFQGESLNLLTWEQYADKSFVEPFEKKYNCKINATFFASGDDLLAKLKAGGGSTYDIISPSGDIAGFLVDSDMLEPVDISHISAWGEIPDAFKRNDVVKGENIYGVPYLWGPDYVMYNADVIKKPITSWNELWDPQYKGRLALHDDISNIYMIGKMLGHDAPDDQSLYSMSDADLAYAKDKLSTLNQSIRKYWSNGGELENLFMNKEVDIAVGWPSTLKNLQDQGMNMGWCIPKEGCTGWFDRLMIVKGSRHVQLATLWIDWCTSAQGEALGSIATTFSVSNPKAADYLNEDQKKIAMVDDLYQFFKSINFWSYVKNREAYNEIWTEVKTSK